MNFSCLAKERIRFAFENSSVRFLFLFQPLLPSSVIKMDNNHLPPAIPSIALSPAEESAASSPLPHLAPPTSTSESTNTASSSSPRHPESFSRQTTTQTFLSSYSTQPTAPSETSEISPPSPALSNEPLFANKNTTSLRDNLDVSSTVLSLCALQPLPSLSYDPRGFIREFGLVGLAKGG